VSLKTAFESGIPPARDRLARISDSNAAIDQLELVLVESTRAEANLGLLVRGLKHLSAGAAAAQEANAVLLQELEALRSRLSKIYESESLLKQRVQSLENVIDASVRERESWLVQEDAFLTALLDEHEQKVFEVERQHERKLAELDLSFDELRREHESARTEVMRLTYERDAAVALLNEPVAVTAAGQREPSARFDVQARARVAAHRRLLRGRRAGRRRAEQQTHVASAAAVVGRASLQIHDSAQTTRHGRPAELPRHGRLNVDD
jgi:chromosome segregation ATPase